MRALILLLCIATVGVHGFFDDDYVYTFFNISGTLSCPSGHADYIIIVFEDDNLLDDALACCSPKYGNCFKKRERSYDEPFRTDFNIFTGDWTDGSPNFELYIEIWHTCETDVRYLHSRKLGYYEGDGSTYQIDLNLDMENFGVPASRMWYSLSRCKKPKGNNLQGYFPNEFYESFKWEHPDFPC